MKSKDVLGLLKNFESRNITFIDPDGTWPIVWDRARGVHVWDNEGRKYLDLTAAFGVAACGHANRRVVRAGQAQMDRLLHAMGDVHPHALKAALARELSRLTFERWSPKTRTRSSGGTKASGKTIFCNSGFEAVEAALKTACLATGKRGVIAFEGAYHGLGYGALNATHRSYFSAPFKAQLGRFGSFVPFPAAEDGESGLAVCEERMWAVFKRKAIGAVLVEPVQVRGGVNIPPPDFLQLLRRVADEHDALLILDEIYTGFGRTGKWFACEHSGVAPDIVCLGKALTGGFPLSACVGRAEIMDAAWPPSTGEAIHTSTFLGHPVGCAMALAELEEIRSQKLVEHSAAGGELLLGGLRRIALGRTGITARGIGLLAGVELKDDHGRPASMQAMDVVKAMLRKGFIVLPEGEYGSVVSFSPPLTITGAQLQASIRALDDALSEVGGWTRKS